MKIIMNPDVYFEHFDELLRFLEDENLPSEVLSCIRDKELELLKPEVVDQNLQLLLSKYEKDANFPFVKTFVCNCLWLIPQATISDIPGYSEFVNSFLKGNSGSILDFVLNEQKILYADKPSMYNLTRRGYFFYYAMPISDLHRYLDELRTKLSSEFFIAMLESMHRLLQDGLYGENEIPLFGHLDRARRTERNRFRTIEKIILREIKRSSKHVKKIKETLTFKWLKSPRSLVEVWQYLLDNSYIDEETTQQSFSEVFSGIELQRLSSKILWIDIGKNKGIATVSIIYLIHVLSIFDLISKDYQEPANRNPIIRHCFTVEGNVPNLEKKYYNARTKKVKEMSTFIEGLN